MDAELSSDQLRAAWRRRSLAEAWTCPDDWWSPAVDELTDSVVRDRRLEPACELLGRARAQAGVGIGETLHDLGAFFDTLGVAEPPLLAMCAVAEGWAEGGLTKICSASCEDPLTGLANVPYLRTRLAELYREAKAEGSSPAETHCLVVVVLDDRADPWRRIARTIVLGHDLREVFTGGETPALLGPGRAAVLTRRRPGLAFRTAGLRRKQARGNRGRIWTEDLPSRLEQALRVLDELAR
ncbi:MAG: hypothetical protein GEV03_25540 [Streptosporangiales bacterium]|nr:hypothetical protein [Streptosporangiales bacterium]